MYSVKEGAGSLTVDEATTKMTKYHLVQESKNTGKNNSLLHNTENGLPKTQT